jgi:hypothetical protein
MPGKLQLKGQIFGRWTVIEDANEKDKFGFRLWVCKCECGTISNVSGNSLKMGTSLSCGCLRNDRFLEAITKHGYGKKREDSDGYVNSEYCIWQDMKQRCTNPNTPHYPDYGGRGICVYEKWMNSFEAFLSDVGLRPSENHSLDRFPDNDGHYEPGNVRWATRKEQMENRRNSIVVEYKGDKKIVSQWAVILGVNHNMIMYHLKRGRPFDQVYEHFKNRSINASDKSRNE